MKTYIQPIIAMLAVINPVICGFIVLHDQKHTDRTTAIVHGLKAMGIVAIILLITAFGGQYVLTKLGISLNAVRVFGGFMLILIGLQMMVKGPKARMIPGTNLNDLTRLVIFAASPATLAMTITLASRSSSYGIPIDALIGIVGGITVTTIIITTMQFFLKSRPISQNVFWIRFIGFLILGMGLQFILEGAKIQLW